MCHKRNNRACDGNDSWHGYSGLAGSERVMVNLRHHLNKDMRDYMKAATEKPEERKPSKAPNCDCAGCVQATAEADVAVCGTRPETRTGSG